VQVFNDYAAGQDLLFVTYNTTSSNYCIIEAQAWTGTGAMPMNSGDNSVAVGHFPAQEAYASKPCIKTATLSLQLSRQCADSEFMDDYDLLAHATVVERNSDGTYSSNEETAWSLGTTVSGDGSWAMYSEYQLDCKCGTFTYATPEPPTEPGSEPAPVSSPVSAPVSSPVSSPVSAPVSSPVSSPVSEAVPVPTPSCETAFAYCSSKAKCFLTDIPAEPYGTFDRWGWTEQVEKLDMKCQLWAGAADCCFGKGTLVGSAIISENYIEITLDDKYYSGDVHFYSGSTMVPLAKNGKSYTVAPGAFPENIPPTGSYTYADLYPTPYVQLGEWVILHTTVCEGKSE